MKTKNPYRLDRTVEPIVYTIELKPDLQAFTFQGAASIALKARKPFSRVTLNAAELKITKATLKTLKREAPVKRISYDKKLETVTLDFGKSVSPAPGLLLQVQFEGILNDKMHGFYRTSYEAHGEKKWGAATQFEATDARRAFPCWDEPDCKARFNLALVVPQELTALSNMPVKKESPLDGGLKRVEYAITPAMPTYLVAFVIADLETIEARDKKGTLVRIYTTPGKKEQGRFALEVALHALGYFAEWFGIPYALPKCDMVALPDFASGAMENWGLVTYRETALLVDPENSSASARQRVAEVIDHELAHQWFGNLVTMRWWTDLWLNEGFASFMGPKAVHDQFPEWKIWDQFIVADTLRALHDDALKNTHPIEIPVQNPSEIREIFDAITYSKGSSVNRMLEHYLGEKVFRKGLQVYLKKFAFGNATTRQLWQVLEKVSGKPVRAIMTSFTDQPGYPMLTIKDRIKKGSFQLQQKRFIFDGSPDRGKTRWKVPLVIATQGMKKPWVGLLKSTSMNIDLGKDKRSWVKLNAGQSGFYRVAYPAGWLDRLMIALKSGSLPDRVIDALGILSDAMALARAGAIETSKLLALFEAVQEERDYNVWTLVAGGLQTIDGLLEDTSRKKRLADFAVKLLSRRLEDFGWEKRGSDSHLDILLRSLLISQAGHFGNISVVTEARARFENFLSGGTLEPNLRGPVYSLVAENGAERDFEELVKLYRSSALQEEKVRILRSLTRFQDKNVIARILEFAISKDVRSQDTYVLLAGFGGNARGRHQAWIFIQNNYEGLLARYEGGSISLLGRILEGAVTGFIRDEDLKTVQTFFDEHPVAGLERTMKQSLEIIRSNIRWSQRAATSVFS
ncbi:MAG: M1 family metallopeptidase [Candidatus Omnitrophica bacterium]|nr:M1 family metallopeptidase [Candidatus Omnitrophota bacterium]